MSLRSNYTQKRSPQYVQVSLALCVSDIEFEKIPLHDAVLESIDYNWSEKSCRVCGRLCAIDPEIFELVFTGVGLLEVAQKEDWVPSSSIKDLESSGSVYIVNMQSGDQIVITAEQYSYASKNT